MGKTDYGFAAFVHLVEDKVAEEFDDVPITRFRPSFVSCKPIECGSTGLECRLKAAGMAHSGRSLMKPNLHRRRTRRPFSSSAASCDSSPSVRLYRGSENSQKKRSRLEKQTIAWYPFQPVTFLQPCQKFGQ